MYGNEGWREDIPPGVKQILFDFRQNKAPVEGSEGWEGRENILESKQAFLTTFSKLELRLN